MNSNILLWFRYCLPAALVAWLGLLSPLGAAELKPDYLTLGVGFNEVFDGHGRGFASVEVRFTPWVAQLSPWVYGSLSTEGGAFVGAGLAYTLTGERTRWRVSLGIGPGYYRTGGDVFLGGDFEVMSFAEVGYQLANDGLVGLRLSHLSNGSTRPRNPGTELLSLQYSIPLGR